MRLIGGSLHNGAPNRSIVGLWAVVGGGVTMKTFSSFNVASLTDNGTGDFTLSMVVPFAAASEYAVFAAQDSGNFATAHIDHSNAPTARTVRVVTVNDGVGGFSDRAPVTVIAVGRR